ncbi:F-box only protein 50 isoform X1 [Dunckerocampus dactyliophorus]|uniref:F-box only protein 50 isoform X1 n=1 Tax=Dunckerocampus dactyliophorus TaxID=161453 RepID=UPI002406EC7F|nr:F-box only protein 50 isoform X1 [Dunckerocampus dactyliophorus]XP_054610785.1 F-box only protein 50 isoform X1 [Dunckerocampus dactyliophorus]
MTLWRPDRDTDPLFKLKCQSKQASNELHRQPHFLMFHQSTHTSRCIHENRNAEYQSKSLSLSKDTPPPEPEMPDSPSHGPPRFQPEGDFSGWTTNTEVLPYDTSSIPEGAVICALPQYSWFSLKQTVDLKAEGLWEELLDDFQPEIVIQDWYEESQLHQSIFQLHVKLLGTDKSSVISEHSVNPTEDLSTYSHTWKQVSHVFSGYGPGVRYIHFLHKLKNQFMMSFYPTMFTGSSVMVRPIKTSS